VDDVVRCVRDALRQRQSDGDLAQTLHRLDLKWRLDNRTAEELESEAPGPESIAELERLRDISRDKPLPMVPPWFASPPEPKLEELRGVLGEARRKALEYTLGLPDFVSTETVRRYDDDAVWGHSAAIDTLTLQLTYFEHKEKYRLTAVDGRKTGLSYESLSGAWSKGEFGSMLLEVFSPTSQAEFRWSNWTTLRHRTAYVLSFRIDAKNSSYRLVASGNRGSNVTATVGEHGLVYIDRETRDVIRLDSQADSIRGDFPVAAATHTLDYGPVEVGGRSFLLPLHAETRMMLRDRRALKRNEIEFSDYRKFTGETSISFGDPVEEGPAAPAARK
jgi:hypothetical protein